MAKPRYLIIAEIENKGFLLDIKNTMKAAEILSAVIIERTFKYAYQEIYKIENDLSYFASYPINGNQCYIGNCARQTTNGYYTVSIAKIDSSFCLKTFLKERENNSIVFDYVNDAEKLDKLSVLFPHPDLNAN